LSFFALLDLGAVGLQQDLRIARLLRTSDRRPSITAAGPAVRASHLVADRAQLVHDFRGAWENDVVIGVPPMPAPAPPGKKDFFDTKNACDETGHLEIPHPSMHASVVDRGVFNARVSRAQRVVLQQMPRTPSVNHEWPGVHRLSNVNKREQAASKTMVKSKRRFCLPKTD